MFTKLAQGNVFNMPAFDGRKATPITRRTFSAASVPEGRTFSAAAEKVYDMEYYLKGAFAGGVCCSFTHGALCPVDVVKTRIQLEPEVYNRGMIGGFRQVIAAEGVGALATGLGPTIVGYAVQGFFKFGGVEFFKIKMVDSMGVEKAWENKTPICLVPPACAEFVA